MRGASVWAAIVLVAAACGRPAHSGAARGALSAAKGVTEMQAPVRVAFVGEGTLEARGERTPRTKLALAALSIDAKTSGDVAETTIEHVFHNDADERLEGTFRFPLPEGAIVTGLAMDIAGKLMEGELVESEKARKTYESIVDEMRDPGLLEWENGQTFRLRVFPIEPRSDKRVVLRLLAPLHRGVDADALFFALRPPGSEPGAPPPRLTVTVDEKRVDVAHPGSTGEVLVPIAHGAPDVLVERTKRGTFMVADLRPSFDAAAAAPEPTRGQALVVLCDRSRSMLEARAMQTHAVSMLLARLEPRDRFALVEGDVRAHAFGESLHVPTEAERTAAAAFVDGTEPDGASDLGMLLTAAATAGEQARAAGLEPVFVYLGDAAATWGETRPAELARMAREKLEGAALHVIVLGKSTDDATARLLAAAAHGRVLHPKSEAEAERAAEAVVAARATRRIDDVALVAPPGVDVPLELPGTLYEGDRASIAAFVPEGQGGVASEWALSGTLAGKPYRQPIAPASATPVRDVAKRWATARIERWQQDGEAHKDDVVQTSLEYGVMSRYTSFLVLESEEEYARFQIARKAKGDAAGDGRVTGRDLDGAQDGQPTVTPDHLQPGDPEIRIPAPADARSVVVDFPFGETKSAVYEQDERFGGGSWVVRFLVDEHTPDGDYTITVRITHSDGRVEILQVPYHVDTQAPALDVVVRRAGSRYRIVATQRLAPQDAPRAAVLTDARRVEVSTPDGQLLSLTALRLGTFVGTWTPRVRPGPHARLRVVAVDRALNERATEVEVP